ncbi:ABC transporter ATP-binding protein [Microbulbifer sp. DLAB2-AA]|uniref:ABC transporter ATP-binding protein n=1 Tax=Microbulbifer sp. DLAB2-AA TaxID=3243394 RepID=UPI0040390C71
MKEIALSFENVGVAFRRKRSLLSSKKFTLRNISFDLYKGETLGVIGHNGAGKSTLLKLLGDIIRPDEGSIYRAPNTTSQLLSLSLGFNKSLSGYENAIMALVTQGKSIKDAKKLAPSIAKFGAIEHLLEQPVGTYSAGERARLSFSIAMNTTPDILLLDEILGVGDKAFKEVSSKELKRRINSNQTAVLVSHSTSTIKEFCDRTLWIDKGILRMHGPANEVIRAYSSEKISMA